MKDNKIKFHFAPYSIEKGLHVITKDEEGMKRKYLNGIASGLGKDAHGEKMTANCIKSFMEQANTGEVLLFPDIHGIRESQDIGKLVKAEVQPDGDWFTEYRLYDEGDGIGAQKAEVIDTLWKQINGFPPYTKPRQKGFSVEGIIPDGAMVKNAMNTGMLDGILLDGVVLVPRPAYKSSIASSVYKALGETSPDRVQSLVSTLRDKVNQDALSNNFYKVKWQYNDALEEMISKIMNKQAVNSREELEVVFEEYKDLMINLILQSADAFVGDREAINDIGMPLTASKSVSLKVQKYEKLLTALKSYSNILETKNAETN